jgi:hypothetical protein
MCHGAFASRSKSLRDLPAKFLHLKRGLWSVRCNYGLATLDLPFRVHFYLWRLFVRRSSPSALNIGENYGNHLITGSKR